jgi:hypothetical protein
LRPSCTVPSRPACATPTRPAGIALGVAQYRRWRGPHGGRGGIGARSRAAVAGRIPVSADGEVDRGRRKGQHGEVGSSIGVSRGGVEHQRGLSTAVAAQWRSSPVLGRKSDGWRQWSGSGHRALRRSSRMEWWPREKSGGFTSAEAAERGQSATVVWHARTPGVAASDSNSGTRLRSPGGNAALGHGWLERHGRSAWLRTRRRRCRADDFNAVGARGLVAWRARTRRTEPPRAANQHAACGRLATNRRAAHFSAFPK